jgi:hypothetical protein
MKHEGTHKRLQARIEDKDVIIEMQKKLLDSGKYITALHLSPYSP